MRLLSSCFIAPDPSFTCTEGGKIQLLLGLLEQSSPKHSQLSRSCFRITGSISAPFRRFAVEAESENFKHKAILDY